LISCPLIEEEDRSLSAGDRSSRPFRAFESQCEEALKTALDKLYPNISVKLPPLSVPPNPEFGELASSISFLLAKELRIKPVSFD